MIGMSSLGNNGRLGNQLFQYSAMVGFSKKYNSELQLPPWPYSKYFNSTYPEGEVKGIEVKEPTFKYMGDLFLDWSKDVDFNGYFQSKKYWEHCETDIRKTLSFKSDFKHQVRNQFEKNNKGVYDKDTIAMSVRRGDYVNNPNYECLPVSYYILALIEHFSNFKDYNIIFFSDDIPWCRCHFDCLENAYFSENSSDIEDLCLLSQCDHFILSNSTFSWWGATLGEKFHSKIVRPNYLFSGDLLRKNDWSDFYPNHWVTFDHKSEGVLKRIDLKDTCFTIPVSYDHEDRKENLDLCVKILQRNFETNIKVYEQGGNHFEYIKDWGVDYHSYTDMDLFHRTKMLNDMAKSTDAKYIFNWDADVIIPPMQILEAVDQLRKGADMIYPYAWAFGRIPRTTWYVKLRDYEDIGIVGDTRFSGMNSGAQISVGGAVGFNRASFIDGGMENENFISYGPEDVERKLRFEKLGYKVERTVGKTMYHLNHWVGVNSSFSNPHYDHNQKEYEKIEQMTKEDLLAYTKSWHWKLA